MRSRRWMGAGLMAAALSLFSGLAQAAPWLKAETPHFVIYSEEGEAPLRDYALMLEDYDALLRAFHGRPAGEATPHKLSVYLVRDEAEFRKVCPEVQGGIVGNYLTTEEDVFLVAVRGAMNRPGDAAGSDAAVLHEYTHHFMLQNYPDAYPAWWVEGYAEYFMTADLAQGGVTIGATNAYRADQIARGKWLPAAILLARDPRELPEADLAGYYAEAWLLTHYVMDDPGRRAAMGRYLAALKAGKDPASAWRDAFHQSPQALDGLLRAYGRKANRTETWARTWTAPEVRVAAIPEGAGQVLLENQLLKREVLPVLATPALDAARENARSHPDDHFAQIAVARGEVKYGDRGAGEALLQAIIAKNPTDAEALRLLAVSRIARGGAGPDERLANYRQAGELLSKSLAVEPDNYQALYRSAQARSLEPGYPQADSLDQLLKAVEASPQIFGARIEAGRAAMLRGDNALARQVLAPVAGDPHGGRNAAAARQILDRLTPLTLTGAPSGGAL